ncbi:MAG: hypothetical protein BWX92_03545 [Deltaproteobacteria bacterium ADurb.Bin135]|nr:MAG: hypothetical protein BWX92_03545 [Deltaproteobacteria bacterium ADurb.Bin135]
MSRGINVLHYTISVIVNIYRLLFRRRRNKTNSTHQHMREKNMEIHGTWRRRSVGNC